MNHRGPLTHRQKKGKIQITEGSGGLTFNYIIDPFQLKCQCSNRPGESICYHLEYYLHNVIGIKPCFFPILSVPRVRSRILDIWKTEPAAPVALNNFCIRFLTDDQHDHCLICHDAYLKSHDGKIGDPRTSLYQCPKCFELYHHGCHEKWQQAGEYGCPRCKYKREPGALTKDQQSSAWPSMT
jgi:hypothetical protein